MRQRNKERISQYNNSITQLNEENSTLKGQLSHLQDDLDKERKNAEKMKDVKLERDELKQQNADLMIRLDKEKKEQYEAGRKSVLGLIEHTYYPDFDALLLSSSLQTIQRDLPFVEDAAIKEKMQDLQSYFEAQKVLSEKYDDQKMIFAQTKIQGLTQSNAVKALGASLRSYKSCYDALKETIEKINTIDNEVFANTDKIQKEKQKDIWAELSDYFLEYRFDFAEYPYLTGIVMEIINRKQRDANADISDLMEKPVKPNSNVRIKPVKP